jgi:hypothetical protein
MTKPELTELQDDLNEVLALNYFLYDSVECIFNELVQDLPNMAVSHHGLVVLLRHLRERSQAVQKQLAEVRQS